MEAAVAVMAKLLLATAVIYFIRFALLRSALAAWY